MTNSKIILVTALSLATASEADTLACDNGFVTVEHSAKTLGQTICDASDTALAMFGQCGLELSDPVTISVVDTVQEDCLAVYHCGKQFIEILAPDVMEHLRNPDSLFAELPNDIFFESVVVHELSHALYDHTPCPFSDCVATSEYLAYNFQIDSLPADSKTQIMAKIDIERRITRDEINAMMLFLAPDRFALKSWVHLGQRPDRCGWVKGIMSGAILFDHDQP